MSLGWRVIDLVDACGDLEYKRGRLIKDGHQISLEDVCLLLVGSQLRLPATLAQVCARFDVTILFCDWRHIPVSSCLTWSKNTRCGIRQRLQAEMSQPRKKAAWKAVVQAKIRGQANNLVDEFAQQELLRIARTVRSGDPDNREGQAARLYWQLIFDDSSFIRDRNAFDRNLLLNYGYTILRGWVLSAVTESGLWPGLGIWHRNRSNPFALVDDLIEPFRPAVDHAVQSLPPDSTLQDKEIKQALVAILQQPFSGEDSVSSATRRFISRFARFVEGQSKALQVPVWRGE